jgi:hypothetical protein
LICSLDDIGDGLRNILGRRGVFGLGAWFEATRLDDSGVDLGLDLFNFDIVLMERGEVVRQRGRARWSGPRDLV